MKSSGDIEEIIVANTMDEDKIDLLIILSGNFFEII